jgi:hypothetical protein
MTGVLNGYSDNAPEQSVAIPGSCKGLCIVKVTDRSHETLALKIFVK